MIDLPYGNWRPRDYQKPIWKYLQNGGKRAIGIWHRRAGKDEVLLHHTMIAAIERPASYWTCLPLYAQARKALWTAVNPHTGKRRIDEAFPHELREKTIDDEMFIRFKNGSTWQLVASDRFDSLVGAGIAGVTFSEWALANPSAWGYIRPMLEENNGWAAFITTPRGNNHAKSMFDMARDNPKWFAEVLSVEKSGAINPSQLAESRAEYVALYGEDLGNAQFEQEYLCSFNAAILGAFYAKEMLAVRTENRVGAFEPDPEQPIYTAWDLGVRDSTAIWWFQILPGKILILDFYSAHGVGVDHYAEVVKARFPGYKRGADFVPHDAKVTEWGTGRSRIETMIGLGLQPFMVGRISDADGHQVIRRTLPLCQFHTRTEEAGMAALENYRREWDDGLKTFKASAVHDWSSHGAKAFQYLSQGWRELDPPPAPPPAMKDVTQASAHDLFWRLK